MAELSGDRMRQMQRDAIRRVEDMQSRARQTLDRANMDLLHGGEPREREEREENGNSPRENGNSPRESGNSGGGGGGGILSDLGSMLSRLSSGKSSISSLIDGDTAILIAIGLLLFTDGKDELLLLAIIYIML